MLRRLASLIGAVALGGCSVVGIRTVEQPSYNIIQSLADNVEVRQYGPRLAAETVVTDEVDTQARSDAFRRLAGYIFGSNRLQQKLAMTAPVAISGAPTEASMTSPLATEASSQGLTMRFFLPAGSTKANAPPPLNDKVRLVEIPAEVLAVLRFTGTTSPAHVAEQEMELSRVLAGSDWRAIGRPVSLFYDPPWTIPFLRRNEVAFAVERL